MAKETDSTTHNIFEPDKSSLHVSEGGHSSNAEDVAEESQPSTSNAVLAAAASHDDSDGEEAMTYTELREQLHKLQRKLDRAQGLDTDSQMTPSTSSPAPPIAGSSVSRNMQELSRPVTMTQLRKPQTIIKKVIEERLGKESLSDVYFEDHLYSMTHHIYSKVHEQTKGADQPALLHWTRVLDTICDQLGQMKASPQIKEMFDAFDKDGDKTINVYELTAVMRNIGHGRVSSQEMEQVVRDIDLLGDGVIHLKEFRRLYEKGQMQSAME